MATNARADAPTQSGTSIGIDGALKPAVERIAATAPGGTPTESPKRAILRLPTRLAENSRKSRGGVFETSGNFNEDYAE